VFGRGGELGSVTEGAEWSQLIPMEGDVGRLRDLSKLTRVSCSGPWAVV
jgi:hypothetical protein